MSLLLASQLSFQSLFPVNAPLEKRLEALEKFFDPPLGSELQIDRIEMREKRGRPLEIQGFVKVRPPKGACLIIRRSPATPDLNVCKPSYVSFSITDIEEDGSIQWLVITDREDSGTPIRWETPYRMARYIGLGNFDRGLNTLIPIASCNAEQSKLQRKLTLELMSGQRWVVLFPENDVPLDSDRKRPNLYVRVMTTGSGGRSQAVEASSGTAEPDSSTTPTAQNEGKSHEQPSVLALRLSGRYRETEQENYTFNFDRHGSFEMDSARLMERNVPMGMQGRCRYRFQGAPEDPKSGVLECFNTESYDAIYLHMTCSAELAPQSH